MEKKIKLGYGFDRMHFGLTVQQVETLLGKPDDYEKEQRFGDGPDDVMDILYYDELGISLSFDKSNSYRMTEIMIDSPAFSLDKIKVGMEEEKVVEIAECMEIGDWYEEELDGEGEEESAAITFDEAGLTLWFDRGVLVSMQMSAQYDEQDNIIWPKE